MMDIIIPTWNNEDYTVRCISSVRKHTKNYRIIWIDNGSNKQSRRRVELELREMNYIKHWNAENEGFVKAINKGLQLSTADNICLLNNDVEVTPNWADKMIDVFKQDSQIGIVGCICSPSKSWQSIDNLQKRLTEFSGVANPDEYELNEYANYIEQTFKGRFFTPSGMIAFFCVVLKREIVDYVGLLSEDYGVGLGDDDDYCARIRQGGYLPAVALDTYVFHNHRTTFKKLYSDDEIKDMADKNLNIFKDKAKKNNWRY